MRMPIRIYADFNNATEDEKVRLNTVGSLADIRKMRAPPIEGMKVLLHDEELEVQARLTRAPDGENWLGIPDWSTRQEVEPRKSQP